MLELPHMRRTGFTVSFEGQVIGKTPIREQAVEAAKGYAVEHGVAVTVTAQYADAADRSCVYHPDGYIEKIWAIDKSEPFRPKPGKVYRNGKSNFYCMSAYGTSGRFVNVKSGWDFLAYGCRQYFDGSIEWDYSAGGHFTDFRLQEAQ